MSALVLAAVLALAALGCGDDSAAPADAGGSFDAGRDAGRRDAGTRDAGPSDTCAADEASAVDTVGCNGDILGAGVADDEFGGRCTPGVDTELAGTCMDPDALCDATEMSTMGICLRFCEPQDTYVSTSDCPEGSRCFTFDPTVALCYPDCEVDADCTSGVCDTEGGCLASDPVLMDGGVGDGGTDDGGTDDGGTDDGGTDDGMADSGMPDSGV